MIEVLIADDHAVVRKGLIHILMEDPQISVKDEASDGYEVLDKLQNNTYSLLILDISMPKKGGLEVLYEVRREYPDLPILIMSIYPEDQYAIRVLKDGASGYLNKEAAPEELISAVKKIMSGHKYLSENIAEQLAFYIEKGNETVSHTNLSDREYAVFTSIINGKAYKEIADDLNLSVKTISTYRKRILEKMQMKNNIQLMQYAVQEKLI